MAREMARNLTLRATSSLVGQAGRLFTDTDIAGRSAQTLGLDADGAEFDHVIFAFHDSHSLACAAERCSTDKLKGRPP